MAEVSTPTSPLRCCRRAVTTASEAMTAFGASSTSLSSHPSSDGTEAASEDSAASEAEAQSPPSSRVTRNRESIGQIASSLSCSTQQVQTALCNIQSTLGLTGQQIINAVQSGDSGIINQLSSCCCNILSAVERHGAATQLQNCQNVNALTNTINGGVRDLKDSSDANSRAILAKLDAAETRVLQDKLDAERQKSATLAAQLNNEHQTAAILSSVGQQLAPVVAGLNALQSEVEKVKCSLPPTISVPYPTVTAVNTELYKAAAYGAAAGSYAGSYGCNGYWG